MLNRSLKDAEVNEEDVWPLAESIRQTIVGKFGYESAELRLFDEMRTFHPALDWRSQHERNGASGGQAMIPNSIYKDAEMRLNEEAIPDDYPL